MKPLTTTPFLLFLFLFLTSCQKTYVMIGTSYDSGTVAQTKPYLNGNKVRKGRGGLIEIGQELAPNDVISFNLGIIGYGDNNFDGDGSGYWSFEYARYFSKNGFGAFVGAGIGRNGRYGGGFILPLRLGIKVDIPFGEKFGMRLAVVNRYQKYLDGEGYNNGLTLMAGFKF